MTRFRFVVLSAALCTLVVGAVNTSAAPEGASGPPGIFVLGIDGVDPVILQRLMDAGRMPNFKKLAAEGGFQSLGTSTPPQSPVAWSNFVTGLNPGGHGIYDFIHRDPATYTPVSSAVLAGDEEPMVIHLMDYVIPLGGDAVANNRSGTPFWDLLKDAGVDTEVYRIPGNYPPTPSDALTLSGMGTVDMRGDFGSYTWYTTEPILDTKHLKADVQVVTVDDADLDGTPDTVQSTLKGPPDLLHLEPGVLPGPDDYLTVPLEVSLDPEQDVVWLKVGSSQAILKEGEWSDWLAVSWDGLPMGLMPLDGIVRFYMKEVRPTFRLYASPVNISPASPAQPITTPEEVATELYGEVGYYYTQGMPEETNALKDRLFDDDDYAVQVQLVREDSDRMLENALRRFHRGMTTFVYLSDIDLQSHMLWRLGDPKYPDAPRHPAYEADAAVRHGDDIVGYYMHIDDTLGRVRAALPKDAVLIVMSDHGFQPFTREFHLNAWLRDQGYLVLKDGKTSGSLVTGDVDWSKTRAYGLGFNAIYLNLEGREGQGIVSPGSASALMSEISEKLLAVRDPANGARVVLRMDRAAEVYNGARLDEAPDLVVGYDRGYGCSDASTLGEVPEKEIEDNLSRWSGNHLMAPEVVPGILLSNRSLADGDHDLTDLTVTLLDLYGLPPGPGMAGRSVFGSGTP